MIKDFLQYKIFELDDYSFTVHNLLSVIAIIVITKVLLILIKKALLRVGKIKTERQDDVYTLTKIITYFIWVISIGIILNVLGIRITAFLTGSAALLVGIGLGLQQTFNDFVSGVILLFEGKTKVGDILEVEGRIMRLKNIGLRTTEGVDRDGISIIIPNSRIVTDKVINWTHQEDKKIRFTIQVGIAYGSDVDLATNLIASCAKEHPMVKNPGLVEVWFTNFGTSSLDFELLFYSFEIFPIERVKSDIRRCIYQKFNENNIQIPFPQMDVHLSKDKA